jgi:hypothetical protein
MARIRWNFRHLPHYIESNGWRIVEDTAFYSLQLMTSRAWSSPGREHFITTSQRNYEANIST